MVIRILMPLLLTLVTTVSLAEDLWVRPKGSFACSGDCQGTSHDDAFNGLGAIRWGEGTGLLGPGDTLRICGNFDRSTEGSVGMLDVKASGLAGRQIALDGDCSSVNPSYRNGRIWGARRIDTNAWTPNTDGTYVTGWEWIHEYAAEGDVSSETLLVSAGSREECARTPGSVYWDRDGRLLYYRPSAGLETVWANWTSAVDVQANDHLTIRNLVLRGGTGGEHGVVKLTGKRGNGRASNVTIKNSDIAFAASQLIECYDGCDDVIIEDNRLHDAPTATYLCRGPVSCARITLRNNEVYSGRDVANIFGQTYADRHALGGQSMNHSLIEGNYIHDWAGDGIHIWVGPGKDGRNNIVRFNRIERIWDSDNANWHNGIALGGTNEPDKAELTAGWKIYGNVIRDLSGGKGELDEAVAIRVKAPASSISEPASIFNNTIVNARVGIWVRENNTIQGLAVRAFNNIIVNEDSQGEFVRVDHAADVTRSNLRFDSNIYFGAARFKYRATILSNLTDWQRVLGGCQRTASDCGSKFSSPLLGSDQSLQAGSPAIDAGESLGADFRYGLKAGTEFPGPALLDQDGHGSGWEVGAFVKDSVDPKPRAPTNVVVD
jgi:hypothetical protein